MGNGVWIGHDAWPILFFTVFLGFIGWWFYRDTHNLPLLPSFLNWTRHRTTTNGALPFDHYPPQQIDIPEYIPLSDSLDTPSDVLPLHLWWNKVVNHDAHIMLVGETRSGKSTTARALLAARARTDKIIVIDPHMKFNDWGSVEAIGDGRNFAAIAQAFLAIHKEFDRRFKSGEVVGSPLTVFIDEYPAIAAARPEVAEYFKQWLRESAKAGIRLILLVQDPNVKTLGIEGEGAVRENLLKILLGSFATKQGASGKYPAALDRRGETTLISTDGLSHYAQAPVSSSVQWPIEITHTDNDEDSGNIDTAHLLQVIQVAQLLAVKPDISQREVARQLWPHSNGGGSYAVKAKNIMNEVTALLRVTEDIDSGVTPDQNGSEQRSVTKSA
jgi:hypothetical protein